MKKPHAIKRLVLNRETLVSLDQLNRAQLDKVAGGSATNLCTGGSSCFPRCTCPPA
jgi:hypothetical protein